MTEERYQMGYSEQWLKFQEQRSGSIDAGHVVKLLRPDSRVLDVGCGPGSITLDLAELATEGHVTGVDKSAEQFDHARSAAQERGLSNATFEEGDAYALPGEDNTFDIVCANLLILHLAEPERAIQEFKRVLKPGGYIALRDLYITGRAMHGSVPCPVVDGVRRANQAILEVNARHGADWDAGIKHRGRLAKAGFENIDSGLSPVVVATTKAWELAAQSAGGFGALLHGMYEQSVELGIMTSEEVDQFTSWGLSLRDDPASVNMWPVFYATGQKPR